MTVPVSTPVDELGVPEFTVAANTETLTVAVVLWPSVPRSPKVSRLSRPMMPWMWNPLAASLTLTPKVSAPPPARSAASGV